MTRAPHPGWHALLAVGGAAAASHAVLERVPARPGLLSPLAHSALVRATRFDALVRPVQLAAVLGRRVASVGAQREKGGGAPDEGEQPDEVRRREAQSALDRSARRVAPVLPNGDAPERRNDGKHGRRVPPPARPRAARPPASPAERIASDGFHASRRSLSAVPPALEGGPQRAPGADGASNTAPRDKVRLAASLAPRDDGTVRGAAETRVIVGTPSAPVRRMLARAELLVGHSTSGESAPSADIPSSVAPSTATSSHRANEGSSALDYVLARISARDDAREHDDGDRRPSGARRRTTPSTSDQSSSNAAPTGRVTNAQHAASASNRPQHASADAATNAAGGVGFRALAARAMQQSDGALPAVAVAAPRLTHELRPMSDLTLDVLDASLADSVTRILQREARRHGIDLAGTGT